METLESGHCAFLSRPNEVVKIIRKGGGKTLSGESSVAPRRTDCNGCYICEKILREHYCQCQSNAICPRDKRFLLALLKVNAKMKGDGEEESIDRA